jgi:glycosyltransferase involved in cell wall biosynthesis
MSTGPRHVRNRRIGMLAYWDAPTALPPMYNHAVSLAADGFAVDLICLAAPVAPARQESTPPGLHITRLRIRSRQLFQRMLGPAPSRVLAAVQYVTSYVEFVTRALVAALRSGASMYEANDLPPLLPAVLAAKLRGKPVVYRAHELWSEASATVRFAAFWRFMERVLVPRCDHVVTPEENRSRIYAAEFGARQPPLTIRNCPPYRPPLESQRLGDELRRRGVTHSTVVLYQGLVHSMRCIEEIAEATRFFDDGIVLVIMGNGYDTWANPAAALADFDRIVVLPPVPYHELLPYTASADIGILLYRNDCRNNYYCAPNKLFEYMMMGLPVIAPDYPGMRSLVDGEDVGRTVDPSSPRAIAAAINSLAADSESRARMHDNGLRLSRARYHWAAESAPLLQLYRDLVDATPRALTGSRP